MPRTNIKDPNNLDAVRMVSSSIAIWAGAGTANAPDVEYNTFGFDQNANPLTSKLYIRDFSTNTWIDTTQTLKGFVGL